jgi:hypothetical protein
VTIERRSTGLPTRPPNRAADTAGFWDALAAGRWVLPRCDACGGWFWYPRRLCPLCGSWDVSLADASGRATLYTFSIIRRGAGPFRASGPYVLAYVELAEGPRLMTNVVAPDVDALHIGMPLRVVLDPAGDVGDAIYRFEPA